jgi:hypothetical protein
LDQTKELEDAWRTDTIEGALWILPRLTILVQSLTCPLYDDEQMFLIQMQRSNLSPQSRAAIQAKLDECSKNYLQIPGSPPLKMRSCAEIRTAMPKLLDDLKSRQYQKYHKAEADLVRLAYEADATGCGMCIVVNPLLALSQSTDPGTAYLAEQLLGSYPMSARRQTCERQRAKSGFGLIGGSWVCPGIVGPTVGGGWIFLPD